MVEKDNKMGSKEKKECDCDEKSDKKENEPQPHGTKNRFEKKR